jgi:hypothetical protein
MMVMIKGQVLFLKVGDRVYHKKFTRWGMGVVVEERTSKLPGGFCYVRVNFTDGQVRVFDNNLKSECCCYYAGIEKIEEEIKYIDVDKYKEDSSPQRKRKALPRGRS